jgi:hypothetical protein
MIPSPRSSPSSRRPFGVGPPPSRALPYGEVYTEDGIPLIETDPYFYMRAIAWDLAHLTFAPFIQFPNGAKPLVGPLFDWGIALLPFPFIPDLSPEGLTRLEELRSGSPNRRRTHLKTRLEHTPFSPLAGTVMLTGLLALTAPMLTSYGPILSGNWARICGAPI